MAEESAKSRENDIIQQFRNTSVITIPALVVLVVTVVLDRYSTITCNVIGVNFYGGIVLELIAVATHCVALVVFKITYNRFFHAEV
jgi:hypothetical protein